MIYIVEDDRSIRELVLYALHNENYKAEGFENSDEFFARVKKEVPTLVMLDIMLPGMNGLEILDKMKKDAALKNIPVIMLTAKTTEFDKITGLDRGADDYITKPFSVLELLARVRALLRRSKVSDGEVLEYAGITLDYEKRVAKVDGREISLTYKEFELLYFLLSNPNIVLTRDRLIEKIWGYDFEGETRTVDVHIASIRSKIEPYQGIIKTIRSLGYKVGDAK